MSTVPSYILALPDDVLIPVLGEVGSASLPTLVKLARTCRRLHSLILRDDRQQIWREVHGRLYDNPRGACAFLTPRDQYEWKQTVIDRYMTFKFMAMPPPPGLIDGQLWELVEYSGIRFNKIRPFSRDVQDWVVRGQLVIRTILGLYDDLPALGHPSRNSQLLEQLVGPAKDMTNLPEHYPSLLAPLCWCSDLYAPFNTDCIRLEVLLSHLPIFRRRLDHEMLKQDKEHIARQIAELYPESRSQQWLRRLRIGRREPNDEPTPMPFHAPSDLWERHPHQTPWTAVHAAAYSPWHLLSLDEFIILPSMDGLQSIRGPGLLGPSRTSHLSAATDVWDWPNLSGRWFGGSARPSIVPTRVFTAQGRRLAMNTQPGFFTLTAVKHPNDILVAMHAFELSHDKALQRWNKVAREVNVPENSPLPPVYFHGIADKFYHPEGADPERRIVYGVVRLTTDSPPQLRWTMAMSKDDPNWPGNWADYVFHGIQVGGRGSERGVLGFHRSGSSQVRGALFRADGWPSATPA